MTSRPRACKDRLKACEVENIALKKNLLESRKAADGDRPLLASGLRLALANQALQVENDTLKKNDAAGNSRTAASQPAGPQFDL